MSDIESICRRLDNAKALRGNWDDIFQQIADRVLPQASGFSTLNQTDGAVRTELMYDATAALALQKFTAAIESFASPRNQRWHTLQVTDKALAKDQATKLWLESVTDLLFKVRYSPRAAFATQSNEAYLSFGAFGTGGIFMDDDPAARVIRYKSLNLSGTWVMENHHGLIDTVFRQFRRSIRQLNQRWPGKLPQKLAEKLNDPKRMDETVEVVHAVTPREDYEPSRMGYPGMPWRSCYLLPGEKHELEEGGYRAWPFAMARYMTSADETYGRSPAWLALSNIKVLNAMKKSTIRAAQKVADPVLLAQDDGVLQAFDQTPGAINFGGVGPGGEQLVQALQTGARVDIGLDMMDRERDIIGAAFLADIYRALIENPQMTATQAMELISERAVLVSPVLGRLQSEFLGNVIEREIDILVNAGQVEPMPQAMMEAQGEYKIEYTSPMSRAMRAGDGVAIMRTLEALTPFAQIDPSVLDPYDLPKVSRELGEINGVPASVMRSPDEVKGMKEGRDQAAQTKQLLDAAPSVTAAASNLVKLQQGGGVPSLPMPA